MVLRSHTPLSNICKALQRDWPTKPPLVAQSPLPASTSFTPSSCNPSSVNHNTFSRPNPSTTNPTSNRHRLHQATTTIPAPNQPKQPQNWQPHYHIGLCINNNIILFTFTQSLIYAKFDIICLTETWLTPSTNVDNEILPYGFNIYRIDRPSRGGGIFITASTIIPSSYYLVSLIFKLIVIILSLPNSMP